MGSSRQQPAQSPDLAHVPVDMDLTHPDRLAHRQWPCDGVLEDRLPAGSRAQMGDTRPEPPLALVPEAAQFGQAAIALRNHRG